MQARDLQKLGDKLQKNKDLKSAEIAYNDAILLYQKENNINDQVDCYMQLGNIRTSLRKYALAIEAYKNAAELYQKSNNNQAIFKCYMEIGLIYKDFLGNNDKAIAYFETALEYFEKIKMAASEVRKYQVQKGYHTFLFYYRSFDRCGGYNPRKDGLDTSDLHLAILCYFNLGMAYHRQNNYERAYENFSLIVKVDSSPDAKIRFDNPFRADCYLHLGDINQIWNRHEDAIVNYEKAWYRNHDENLNFRILYSMGISLQASNQHACAIEHFEKSRAYILTNSAEQAKCCYQIAISYQSLNEHDNAIRFFDLVERALNHVNQADFYYQYAISYASVDRHKSAIEYFNLAKDSVNISPQKKALCHYHIANSHNTLNNAPLALQNYEKAIANLADSAIEKAISYFRSGLIYQIQQNRQAAIEHYDQAIRLFSDNEPLKFKSYHNLVCIYHHLNNIEKLIEHSTQAIALAQSDQDKARMFYARGNAYQKQGNSDEAIQDYQNALLLDPQIASLFGKKQLQEFFTKHHDFYETRLKHLLSEDVQKDLLKPNLTEEKPKKKKHDFSIFNRHKELEYHKIPEKHKKPERNILTSILKTF